MFWYYVSFVTKGPGGSWSSKGGGDFMGAVVVEATTRARVADVTAFDLGVDSRGDAADRHEHRAFPKDKLPAEEFRNKLLTRSQVETLWPGVKG